MRLRPNLELYNDLCVAIEQAMWEAKLIDSDRTVAMPGDDGIPTWREPDPVIAAIASRCTAVFATHGVVPEGRWRMAKDGSRQ